MWSNGKGRSRRGWRLDPSDVNSDEMELRPGRSLSNLLRWAVAGGRVLMMMILRNSKNKKWWEGGREVGDRTH